MSLFGRRPVLTPNLDALGAGGVVFERAYSTCPVCIPARRSLMSGLFPKTHGLLGFVDNLEWEIEHTLPGELRKAGYQTYLVGRRMHLSPRTKRYGFDHFEDTDSWLEWLEEQTSTWQGGPFGHGVNGNGYVGRPSHLPEHLELTNWTVQQGIRFLKRRDPSCPFFLVLSFAAPHPPLTPPAYYFDRYLHMDLGRPVIGDWAVPPPREGKGQRPGSYHVQLEGELWRNCAAGYYGLINHVDDQVALFLSHLGAFPNTYVVFTSDHGEMLGDHYMFRKTLPYEGSARIPLIFKGPGIPSGQSVSRPACLEDIFPTLLDLAGVETPGGLDGESLVPAWSSSESPSRIIHIEYPNTLPPEREGYHCLTDGKQKYIWKVESGREQLFDLDRDPDELHDLAPLDESKPLLQRWRKALIDELRGRPEGFTDGDKLIPGRKYGPTLPHVHGRAPIN